MSAQQPSIVPFTHNAYEELSKQFDPHPVSGPPVHRPVVGGRVWLLPTEMLPCTQLAMQFISQYSPEDIVTVHIEGSSGALWRISPPSRAQMKRELYNGTADITLRFTWNFQRCVLGGAPHPSPGTSEGHPGQRATSKGHTPHQVTLCPCCRDLAKGGSVEYTNEKHTLDLAPNSTARRQLASLLEGTSDQSV